MNIFKPFLEGELDGVLRNQHEQIKARIHNEKDNYLININEDEYVEFLCSEFKIDVPEIDFESKTISTDEKMILASRHPSSFFMFDDGDKSFKRQVITFHLPFTGDVQILNFAPNPRILWTQEIKHSISDDGEELSFEIINFSNDPETIKRESEHTISSLKTQLGHIKNQVDAYNSNLKQDIISLLKERKDQIIKNSDFLSQLGIPVRKRDNLPETYSIPTPKIPKQIIPKPVASLNNSKIEPTVDVDTYNEILTVIHDVGKAIERMPSTYRGKDEETLRDHILVSLEPRFIGSTTGETFNKIGKTDILLRYEHSNVFVAECKFWGGEKMYQETINQILGYLSWRDSKAAVILFVKNSNFSSILQKVKDCTPNHPNYVSFEGERENTWLSYKFSLNGDADRKIFLTILVFHFPE